MAIWAVVLVVVAVLHAEGHTAKGPEYARDDDASNPLFCRAVVLNFSRDVLPAQRAMHFNGASWED